ncbi:MAG: NAD(P)-dependent alcohol dehydrogenase [Herpetosiphonaceae bacterium]|nr:NAD(P)-dependent alcohol dehydrogenase [Herpetosiphonaceae bacterium]
MQAVQFHSYGSPDVLRIEEVEQPHPKADQVLIRVLASSINPADVGGREGSMRLIHARHLPHIPGYDVVGEVASCGPAVTAFVPGERVWAMVGLGGGAQAEYVAVRQSQVAPAPQQLSVEEAAAVPLAGLTALQALRRKGHVQGGERVLINGAAGGVGSFAVQIAKLLHCHVTAVCRTAQIEAVGSLGADEIVDYTHDDVLAHGKLWNVVLDTAGSMDFRTIRRMLTPNGIMVTPAGRPQDLILGAFSRLRQGPRYGFVITRASGHDLALLARLADRRALRPLVDQVFDISRIQEAYRYFEQSRRMGKIVIRVAPG